MTKEMIISSNGHETMVAILEDDQVTEVFIERERQRGVVGNVYKGRVSKVLPGMQSAFVDIGLDRDAFLYVSDVVDTLEEFERLEMGDAGPPGAPAAVDLDHADDAGAPVESASQRDEQLGLSESLTSLSPGGRQHPGELGLSGSLASLSAGGRQHSGELGLSGSPASLSAGGRQQPKEDETRERTEAKIEDLLKEGQEVIIQVVKEPLGTKGARVTSHVTMPGRFLVFMPTVDHVGVSRKIESREERARLRGIVRQFREQQNFTGGVIIRTAAAGCAEDEIVKDLQYFHRIWSEVRQRAESARPPAVIYREQSLVAKLLRDLLTDEYSMIRIDNDQEYRRVSELVERFMPHLRSRVKHYTKDFPIFEEYGIQSEIDKALRSKVWLKSGGYIVVNQTEALVAIDVNTGRYVGKRTGRLEDTIVKTNLEAVKEIVRQIRLRDLGGIIVLDFIDMEERKNRQKVFQGMEAELRKDRSPSKALQVSDFGLVILTRKRVKQSLERQLTEPCPYCSGSGVIKSTATICFEILAEIRKVRSDLNGHGVILRVNPEIARALKEEESAVLRDLEDVLGRTITIKSDVQLHHEQFDVMTAQ